MIETKYYGEHDEIQAVFVFGKVVNVRLANLFSLWTGNATAWSTIKRFS